MESSLQLHGISLSPHLLNQTLLRLQHSSKIALAFFHFSQSIPPHAPPPPSSYNLIIDILSKVRQFDVIWQLIIQMDQQNVAPISSAFLILIRRLIAAGLTRQAVRAFDDMKCFVEKEDMDEEVNFSFLLDTLCKYGYVRVAVDVFRKKKHEIIGNVKMYTSLIYGWCKINRIDMAERFLNEMIERGIEPNVVTYNVLLNGVCRRASLHPDERFERTIMRAEKVFDEMRMRGIEPDVTSFSIVLHVYSRAHKPQLTMDKLKLMQEKGICPSVVTYTSAVKCLCSCGKLEDAEQLLEEMEIWGDMKGSEVGPDLDSYTMLIHGLCEKQKWKEACQFFVEMIEKGLLPQKVTFETLYRGLIQSDMLRTWRRLKKKLDEESITFGSEFQNYHLKPYRR
ncbi:hypothetical protein Pint_27408 [Pistacia integerrima]|uniref:Uncharacterized protein n=1 Tax=Pistacia integerrima TaxID=434235 RepID=A0ACC0YQR8_9ROSI|nr:hypothetical protein Pint_27408 [Pistacia integerrima]